jgi:hypothetical protein
MRRSRRVRRLATAGVGLVAGLLGLAPGPAGPAAVAAPSAFTISGAGYGHGIGMSQYGAQGMAVGGAAASRILAFYYGGAKAGSARLPATIRVGLLQANRDPAAGGRLARVRVQAWRSRGWAAAAASPSPGPRRAAASSGVPCPAT